MDRREAVKYISFMMGGAMVGGTAIISGCKTPMKVEDFFTPEEIALLDEVGDTIIPTTDTPGAKATGIGAFMALMVKDTYTPEDQAIFKEGISKLQSLANEEYGSNFEAMSTEDKHSLLSMLNDQIMDDTTPKETAPQYFRMMKQLTLLGYFTSEIGVTQARRYAPVPGKYEPCLDYQKGDKFWIHSI
jgi:hypothetical protein